MAGKGGNTRGDINFRLQPCHCTITAALSSGCTALCEAVGG
ncbi:hypothetical protein [Planktothrix sp.]